MNKRSVGYAIGKLLQVLALILVVPLFISLLYDVGEWGFVTLLNPEVAGFTIGICFAWFIGMILVAFCKAYRKDIRVREGYAVVTLGWIVLSAVGCLPLVVYWILNSGDLTVSRVLIFITDAYFETMSGFTTTGSTILSDIEAMPRGILFWRSMTHWLGGMGIITLALAIFPTMGVSGYGMYRGEVPGPTKERLQPRLNETAKILWGVYLLFTVVETLLLMLGGMTWFDSLCHTFGTLATGGFSTQNLSVGQYGSMYINWVIILFMALSGINYIIHYRVILRRDFSITLKDSELHFYLMTILVCVLVFTGVLYFQGLPDAAESYEHYRHQKMEFDAFQKHVAAEEEKVATIWGAFSQASFQVVAIITTTGYGTADFDTWPDLLRFILLVLMFWGGCAGSTGGGLKIIRVLTVFKVAGREIRKLANPRWIAPLKIGDTPQSESRIINILALFNLFIILFVLCTVIMTFFVPDLLTAITSVAATLCNIGPGLSGVGSVENFGWIPIPGKWVLTMCMLLGRLEIFSVLIALRPSIWQK